MKVGVIGSGSIGPDLAYGFVSALARRKEGQVTLMDIKEEALQAGRQRIQGYVRKGMERGKLSPSGAQAIEDCLVTTTALEDLADCDYVLEAATEELPVKKAILKNLENTVGADCLIGFATSGIPRAQIAAETKHPERCFVNHPFFPAWRSAPVEVVLSGEESYGDRMLATLRKLGKVPIITSDVPCFAADDVFCNYCAEAARIYDEGVATPAQVDAIVNDAIGGGGPFNVMDLTRGNLLGVHCMQLMRDAPTGSEWFEPPPILAKQGLKPWIDRKNPGDPHYDAALRDRVLNRILAVLFGRSYFVVDHGICSPREFNWLTRMALGFRAGLLDLAEEVGAERVREICTGYAAEHPGFDVPASIAGTKLPEFYRNITSERDGDLAVVSVFRPEVMNALNGQTLDELRRELGKLEADPAVKGIVLTSYDGSLAGADILELAALPSATEAEAKSRQGQDILSRIEAMSKPVVAAIDGPVLGGGAELSMACHARVVGRGLLMGQPEVDLGIIPGYGGTQRLPRLVGVARSWELLRTGRKVGAKEAWDWGWASAEPAADVVAAAKDLLRRHLAGELKLAPVSPEPMSWPGDLPTVDIGHRSLAIDAILTDVIRRGITQPLAEGLATEAKGFGRCKQTVDYDIGMKNFIQNGPRVPAAFLHE
jgi:enoyl-CoA hydratase/3-hydroxyacyl-CoA dehydrogenase